jgi:carboxylesterase
VNDVSLLPGAAPFFYPGDRIGCLVVHGFTGMPQEVRWLGQHLHRQGHTVYGPRLAGHGTAPQDMMRATWREWVADVLAGYAMLRAGCDAVFAIGLSMGGALSLLLASREPVAGVVSMSAPYEVNDWRVPLIPILEHVVPVLAKKRPPFEQDPFQQAVVAEQRARGEPEIGHVSYPVRPLRAVGELVGLLAEVRAGLPDVTAPALLIHSTADQTVAFDSLAKYTASLGSPNPQTLTLDRSSHCTSEDCQRDQVFEAVAHFVAGHI